MTNLDKYRSLFEYNSDAIAIVDTNDHVLEINQTFEDMFGFDVSELNSPYCSFHLGFDEGLFNSWVHKCRKNQRIANYKTKRRNINGLVIDVSITVSPLYDDENKLFALALNYRDISDLLINNSKLHYQDFIFKNLKDAIITTDNDLLIHTWSYGAEELYQWKSFEVVGKHVDELLKTSFCDQSIYEAQEELLRNGVWNGDLKQEKKSGEIIFVNATVTWLKDEHNKIIGGISLNRDITRIKLSDQLLINSELEKTTILDNQDFNVVLQDKEHKILWVNQTAANTANKLKSELIGQKCHEALGFIDCKEHTCPVKLAVETGKPQVQEIYFDNGEYWRIKGVPIYNSDDILEHVIEISENITEKKVAEIKIKESEEKYRSLVENAPVGISITKKNNLIFANKKMLEIYGFDTFEQLAKTQRISFVHPEDLEMKVKKQLIHQQNPSTEFTVKFRIINNKNEIKHLLMTTTEIHINSEVYSQNVFVDKTELIELKMNYKALSEQSSLQNEKNKIIDEFKKLFVDINSQFNVSEDINKRFEELFKKYHQPDKDWQVTKSGFEHLHKNFYSKLLGRHPALTQNEVRHITYMKMNYSTKEIARIFSVEPSSIQKARVRLKKKLNLRIEDDLYLYIHDF